MTSLASLRLRNLTIAVGLVAAWPRDISDSPPNCFMGIVTTVDCGKRLLRSFSVMLSGRFAILSLL